jgi:hypothetical protein
MENTGRSENQKQRPGKAAPNAAEPGACGFISSRRRVAALAAKGSQDEIRKRRRSMNHPVIVGERLIGARSPTFGATRRQQQALNKSGQGREKRNRRLERKCPLPLYTGTRLIPQAKNGRTLG